MTGDSRRPETTALPGVDMLRLPVKRPGPKGLAPYRTVPGSKNDRILTAVVETVDRYSADGRLPLGSREVGYVLTERGWTHDDVPAVEEVVERARRAGLIPWDAISDGRTSDAGPWTVDGADEIADRVLASIETAQLDRQAGQPYRGEFWSEAASWLPRLRRLCAPFGVRVYSGSGSVPIDAVRRAALRVLAHAEEQRTVLLWIGDLDVNGLRNIATPFGDDVRKFAIDIAASRLGGPPEERASRAARLVDEVLVVKRLLLTPAQVPLTVESARADVTNKDIEAGWRWPWKVQAEALLPEIRDRIVLDALNALLDPDVRERVKENEAELHREARARLRDALDEEPAP